MDKQRAPKSKESAKFQVADELGGIELLDAQYETQNFSRHSHEGYTVGVIERGAQRFYRTGGNHVAPQDSIILVNADEVHTGHSAVEGGWAYKAMYRYPSSFRLSRASWAMVVTALPTFPKPWFTIRSSPINFAWCLIRLRNLTIACCVKRWCTPAWSS